jgi:hypothetical protein
LHPRIIAIPCDRNYFASLKALINSVHAYHPELPIFVFERGFHTAELAWLSNHSAHIEVRPVARFPYPAPGMWEAKQQVPSECITHARTICLIDADIVLLSRIDDVFELAEEGRIVAGRDGFESYFNTDHQVYSPSIVGQKWDHLNSGLVCFDVRRHWDLAGLWAFSSNYGGYTPNGGYPIGLPGMGDQGLLDGVLAILNKRSSLSLLPMHTWHDFRAPGTLKIIKRGDDGTLEVQNGYVGERQRIAHNIGHKWWLPGAEANHPPDDKLTCFRHFAGLDFRSLNRSGNQSAKNGKRNGNGTVKGKGGHNRRNGGDGRAVLQAQSIDLRALLVVHCTGGHERLEQIDACLSQWRTHHPQMPGLLISDGPEPWHGEVAERFELEYHQGIHCRSIEFGALWLTRFLTLAIDAAERSGCDVLWRIHPDTLVQRPFETEPPDADWFGHIHNSDAPHVHGGSSFLRIEAARRILARISRCDEFAEWDRWLPATLNADIREWAERTGWISAEYMIAALRDELGLQIATWPEIHSGCGLTPIPENSKRFAVLHPVRLPRQWT